MAHTDDLLGQVGSVTAGMLPSDDSPLNQYAPNAYQQQQQPAVLGGGALPITPMDAPRTPSDRRPNGGGRSRMMRAPGDRRLAELFIKHNPASDVNFKVTVERISQKTVSGQMVQGGYVGEFPDVITEKDIYNNFGGGKFLVILTGSHPKTYAPDYEIDRTVVQIEGAPRIAGELIGGHQNRDDRQPWSRDRQTPLMINQPQQDSVSPFLAQTVKELAFSGRNQPQQTQQPQGLDPNLLSVILQQREKSGIDPSTYHTAINNFNAQKEAIQAKHQAELSSLKEQLSSDYNRLKEQTSADYERMKSRLEGMAEEERRQAQIKAESSERTSQSTITRIEEDLRRERARYEDERKDFERKIDRLKDDHTSELRRIEDSHKEELRRLDSSNQDRLNIEQQRSDIQRQSIENTAKSSVEGLQKYFELTKKSDESHFESSKKMLEWQVDRESEDRKKAERELEHARREVEKKEDLPTQLTKIKSLTDMVADFAGLGQETAIVPTGDSTFDKIQGLLSTPAGKKAGEVAGAILGGVAQRLIPGQQPAPMQPTPRHPHPQMAQHNPNPQAQQQPQNVEQALEQQLYQQQQAQQQVQQPQQQAQQQPTNPESVSRIQRWVDALEGHIAAGTTPEAFAGSVQDSDLPPEAMQGLMIASAKDIVTQIAGAGIQMKGILPSDNGIAYLESIQKILRSQR
jgi:hypothetical protein